MKYKSILFEASPFFGIFLGVSTNAVFFKHQYIWLLVFIPTIIYSIWYIYTLIKK